MKKIALFVIAAGMISMVACKSAPKQEEATEQTQQETAQPDTAAQAAETPAQPAPAQ